MEQAGTGQLGRGVASGDDIYVEKAKQPWAPLKAGVQPALPTVLVGRV